MVLFLNLPQKTHFWGGFCQYQLYLWIFLHRRRVYDLSMISLWKRWRTNVVLILTFYSTGIFWWSDRWGSAVLILVRSSVDDATLNLPGTYSHSVLVFGHCITISRNFSDCWKCKGVHDLSMVSSRQRNNLTMYLIYFFMTRRIWSGWGFWYSFGWGCHQLCRYFY